MQVFSEMNLVHQRFYEDDHCLSKVVFGHCSSVCIQSCLQPLKYELLFKQKVQTYREMEKEGGREAEMDQFSIIQKMSHQNEFISLMGEATIPISVKILQLKMSNK